VFGDAVLQAYLAEDFAVRIGGLDQSVGEEQDALVPVERAFGGAVAGVFENTQSRPGMGSAALEQSGDAAAALVDDRAGMTGAGVPPPHPQSDRKR
jgi:hypothetical protein